MKWNKYQWKVRVLKQKRYLNYLNDPSFQGVNRLFALSFENNTGRASYTRCYDPQVEIKGCNIMIDGRNFFDQLVNNNLRRYGNIRNIATGQRR